MLIVCEHPDNSAPGRKSSGVTLETHDNFILHCLSCNAYVIFEGFSVEPRSCVRCHALIQVNQSIYSSSPENPIKDDS